MGKFIPVEPEKWAKMVKAMAENARLKAEVDRLTKAGDRVLHTLLWTDEYDEFRYKDAKKIWDAAKEGKQS